MVQKLLINIMMTITIPAAACEHREVSNAAEPKAVELAASNEDLRSFFEPKTESDVNALVTLEQGFELSLTEELSN